MAAPPSKLDSANHKAPRNSFATAVTRMMITLDEQENSPTDWEFAFVINRIVSVVLGLPSATVFGVACWILLDILVPVPGIALRFSTFLSAVMPGPAVKFFDIIDACGLGSVWLDRADIVFAVSVLIFGVGAGNHLRTSIVGRRQFRYRTQLVSLAMSLLIVIAAAALCAIHRAPKNPGATAICVQAQTLRSGF